MKRLVGFVLHFQSTKELNEKESGPDRLFEDLQKKSDEIGFSRNAALLPRSEYPSPESLKT